MHKFTFCLLLVFALTITSFKATAQNPDNPLIEIFNTNHGNGGRTLTRIAVAYYNPDTQTVTLRYHASEDAVIYFVSPDNTLLDTEYVEEGEYEEIVFNVPSAPGTYTLVVRSESFTGEGRFSVEYLYSLSITAKSNLILNNHEQDIQIIGNNHSRIGECSLCSRCL